MLRVLLRCMTVVLLRVQRMTVWDMGVMRGFLVIARLGVLGSLTIVFRGVFAMLRGFLMVSMHFVTVHRLPPC
jgi:hypothetical protein